MYDKNPSDSSLPLEADSHEQDLLQNEEEIKRAALQFLDQDLFHRCRVQVPWPIHAAYPILGHPNALGDIAAARETAARYYQRAHPWLPFISKRKVLDQLLNPLIPPRKDTAFLLIAMKLISQAPENKNAWASEYHTAVRFRTDPQLMGTVSLEILQANILLAAYENGHAIYPGAYISIGICLQYAKTLGMSWSCSAEGSSDQQLYNDMEERKRTWWAIFLLERYALPHRQ